VTRLFAPSMIRRSTAARRAGDSPGAGSDCAVRRVYAVRRRWRMIRRRSRSVVPPHTPTFSRLASACSRHATRTSQPKQISLASRTCSSDSGKKMSGSSPRHAPIERHPMSMPTPLDLKRPRVPLTPGENRSRTVSREESERNSRVDPLLFGRWHFVDIGQLNRANTSTEGSCALDSPAKCSMCW
jgi:hypothetical protein